MCKYDIYIMELKLMFDILVYILLLQQIPGNKKHYTKSYLYLLFVAAAMMIPSTPTAIPNIVKIAKTMIMIIRVPSYDELPLEPPPT